MINTYGMLRTAAPLALIAMLAGCGGPGISPSSSPISVAPGPAPTPTPTPTPAAFNVMPCLGQIVPGTSRSVLDLIVPDTLTLDLNSTAGFPNGRRLTDPVIDVTLNAIFLRLSTNGPGTLASVPVNPAANDLPFRPGFPYLAAAQGAPPVSGTAGVNFNFRTDPDSAFVRVDRMGMPAVATALIASPRKSAYNDIDPSDDAALRFAPDLIDRLATLTGALADDFIALGLTPCATPN